MKRTQVILMIVFILVFSATVALAESLTGVWACNDGGKYYLTQSGNVLWWLGESGNNGASWTNVFQGNISGNNISGKWADVPQGQIMGSGIMNLIIVNPSLLRATTKTGGFGGSEWRKIK